MNSGEELALGMATLGVRADKATQQKLLDYATMIAKWNRAHNLTAVREVSKMVSAHLLDSLAVAPHVEGRNVLDVGSGAGLPGIPLAMIWPQSQVTLLDSNTKKSAFLRQAAIEQRLPNVKVVCERVESWNPPCTFELVISRAFAEINQLLSYAGRLCSIRGTVAAMKGVYPQDELNNLPPDFVLRDVVKLNVPGVRGERHLVLLSPRG